MKSPPGFVIQGKFRSSKERIRIVELRGFRLKEFKTERGCFENSLGINIPRPGDPPPGSIKLYADFKNCSDFTKRAKSSKHLMNFLLTI